MTEHSTRPLQLVLWLCALSDLAAVPLLMSGDDGPGPAVAVVVGLLGLLTAAAAIGLARDATWARPLAWATRIVDAAAALPGLAVGGAVTAAVAVTIGLSLVAMALLARSRSVAVAA